MPKTKVCLGLVIPNQYCPIVAAKIEAGFRVILLRGPRLLFGRPYYKPLLWFMIRATNLLDLKEVPCSVTCSESNFVQYTTSSESIYSVLCRHLNIYSIYCTLSDVRVSVIMKSLEFVVEAYQDFS